MKPGEPQYVCHACIGDKFLAEQVEKEGAREECTYCRATNTAFTLADLSNRIHRVLEEHFEPIPEDDPPEQFRQGLYDTEAVIKEVARLEQNIAADVRGIFVQQAGCDGKRRRKREKPFQPRDVVCKA